MRDQPTLPNTLDIKDHLVNNIVKLSYCCLPDVKLENASESFFPVACNVLSSDGTLIHRYSLAVLKLEAPIHAQAPSGIELERIKQMVLIC